MLVRLNIFCLEYLKPYIKTISNSLQFCVQRFQIIRHLSGKWIFDDKNVFIACDVNGVLNEWIKLFKNTLKGH